jgi:putative transcriptional regulator
MRTSKELSLSESLRMGLEEGIQFAKGKLNLRTTEVPVRPPSWHARQVVQLRQQLNMSQSVFAQMVNVSLKTVQSWEQGERQPSQAALRLLQILEARPAIVCRIVGIRMLSARRTARKQEKAPIRRASE